MSLVAESSAPAAPKPTFPCPACGAQYSRLEYLRRHERKHNEDRPFACNDCTKSFARSDVLLRHRRRCHPDSVASDTANAAMAAAASAAPSGSSPVVPRVKTKEAKKATASARARRNTNATSNSGDGSASSPEVNHPTTPPSEASNGSPIEANILSGTFANYGSTIESLPDLPVFDHTSQWSAMNSASIPSSLLPQTGLSSSNFVQEQAPSQSLSLMPLISPSSYTSSPPYLNGLGSSNNSPPLTSSWSSAGFTPSSVGSSLLLTQSPSDVTGGDSLFFDDPLAHIGHVQTTFGKWYTFPPDPPASPRPPPNIDSVFDYLGGDPLISEFGLDVFGPEKALYRMDDMPGRVSELKGCELLDPSDKFYLPIGVFSGCYMVTHWMLPPIIKLSKIARHTLGVLKSQMPIIHEPTFRLDRAHAFIAFALSTIGTKDIFSKLYDKEECPSDPWHYVPSVVRSEKSEMLVKNFMRRSQQMSFKESFAVVQALIIYYLPNFLSKDPGDRMTAQTFLATIIQIARQCDLFSPTAEFNMAGLAALDLDFEGEELEAKWHHWVYLETIRRTIWLVYVLDTLACLESSLETRVSPRELRYMPLPAPNCVWEAKTGREWAHAVRHNAAANITLDYMMNKTCHASVPNHTPPSNPNEGRLPIANCCLGTRLKLGPFARMVIILTMLRGLIDFGEGKRKGGTVTQTWAMEPRNLDPDFEKGIEERVLITYRRAFDRWRQGWDFDKLCHGQFNPPPGRAQVPEMCSSSFVNDATPYYWLAMLLMDSLPQRLTTEGRLGVFRDGDPFVPEAEDVGRNLFKGFEYRSMLGMTKEFAHAGEGLGNV